MSRQLDDLARALAQPMPRRRAIRVFGAATLATMFPVLRPRTAAAQVQCTNDATCPAGTTCCVTSSIRVQCCQKYETCKEAAEPGYWDRECQCADPCGDSGFCCQSFGMQCVKGQCVEPCREGRTRCGTKCCGRDEECVRGRCRKKCPRGRARCGDRCCGKRSRCKNARRGTCERCPRKREACGDKCCGRKSFCCDPDKGLCCPRKGGECCPDRKGKGRMCCERPRRCARPTNEDANGGHVGVDRDGRFTCCPKERYVKEYRSCCPRNHVSLGGRLVLPPGRGGGNCCRKDKVCGDSCCAIGSKSFPEQDQICCGGRCVNHRISRQHCGGCGRRCRSGERCENGTCVPA